MEAPILGVFDPTTPKKKPHVRAKVLESRLKHSNDDKFYPYQEMLNIGFHQMQNDDLSPNSRRIELPSITINKKGKKTIFVNFSDICQKLNRDSEHIKQYICTELDTDASIDSSGGLIIGCRLKQNQIEKYIIQYVQVYVKCPVCGSMHTKLEKNNRLLFIICNQCTANKSIPQIKAGVKTNTTKRNMH